MKGSEDMANFDYYVEQRYFNKGETRTRILNNEQAIKLGYYNGYTEETGLYDLYVDGCKSLKEAEKLCNDVANC